MILCPIASRLPRQVFAPLRFRYHTASGAFLQDSREDKEKLLKMDKKCDFLKGLSESKSTDVEEVYLAAVDLIERGYDPKQLIAEVLNN